MIKKQFSRLSFTLGFLAFYVLACGLQGCGYELRGYKNNPLSISRLNVIFHEDNIADWENALKQRLALSKVAVDRKARFTLHVLSTNQTKSIASYDSRGKAAEYQLTRSLRYRIDSSHPSGTATLEIGPEVLRSERTYAFDPKNLSGKTQEERLLNQELLHELMQRLIRRLGKLSSTPSSSPQSPNSAENSSHTTKGSK